jgi:hypothetical protein
MVRCTCAVSSGAPDSDLGCPSGAALDAGRTGLKASPSGHARLAWSRNWVQSVAMPLCAWLRSTMTTFSRARKGWATSPTSRALLREKAIIAQISIAWVRQIQYCRCAEAAEFCGAGQHSSVRNWRGAGNWGPLGMRRPGNALPPNVTTGGSRSLATAPAYPSADREVVGRAFCNNHKTRPAHGRPP